MTRSTSSFNVVARITGGHVFENANEPRVNACFFMPCTDHGQGVAKSLVTMFRIQGYHASLNSAPSTKNDLGRYEVNACNVPEGLAGEAGVLFQDALDSFTYGTKNDARLLGYGSGIHNVQDDTPALGPDRRRGPR